MPNYVGNVSESTDGTVNVGDAQYILNWIAAGGKMGNLGPVYYSVNKSYYTMVDKMAVGNLSQNQPAKVNIGDAQYILNWIAAGGTMGNLGPVYYSVNNSHYEIINILDSVDIYAIKFGQEFIDGNNDNKLSKYVEVRMPLGKKLVGGVICVNELLETSFYSDKQGNLLFGGANVGTYKISKAVDEINALSSTNEWQQILILEWNRDTPFTFNIDETSLATLDNSVNKVLFYDIEPSININNMLTDTYSTQSYIIDILNRSQNIIQDLISIPETYNIDVVDISSLDINTISTCDIGSRTISLNPYYFDNSNTLLYNDVSTNCIEVAIIHSVLNILGINSTTLNESNQHIIDVSGGGRKYWDGPKGRAEYINTLEANNCDISGVTLPIITDWKEQYVLSDETLIKNNILCPAIENDMINILVRNISNNIVGSDIIDTKQYLTPITMGILNDVNPTWTMNMSSQYLKKVGDYLRPWPKHMSRDYWVSCPALDHFLIKKLRQYNLGVTGELINDAPEEIDILKNNAGSHNILHFYLTSSEDQTAMSDYNLTNNGEFYWMLQTCTEIIKYYNLYHPIYSSLTTATVGEIRSQFNDNDGDSYQEIDGFKAYNMVQEVKEIWYVYKYLQNLKYAANKKPTILTGSSQGTSQMISNLLNSSHISPNDISGIYITGLFSEAASNITQQMINPENNDLYNASFVSYIPEETLNLYKAAGVHINIINSAYVNHEIVDSDQLTSYNNNLKDYTSRALINDTWQHIPKLNMTFPNQSYDAQQSTYEEFSQVTESYPNLKTLNEISRKTNISYNQVVNNADSDEQGIADLIVFNHSPLLCKIKDGQFYLKLDKNHPLYYNERYLDDALYNKYYGVDFGFAITAIQLTLGRQLQPKTHRSLLDLFGEFSGDGWGTHVFDSFISTANIKLWVDSWAPTDNMPHLEVYYRDFNAITNVLAINVRNSGMKSSGFKFSDDSVDYKSTDSNKKLLLDDWSVADIIDNRYDVISVFSVTDVSMSDAATNGCVFFPNTSNNNIRTHANSIKIDGITHWLDKRILLDDTIEKESIFAWAKLIPVLDSNDSRDISINIVDQLTEDSKLCVVIGAASQRWKSPNYLVNNISGGQSFWIFNYNLSLSFLQMKNFAGVLDSPRQLDYNNNNFVFDRIISSPQPVALQANNIYVYRKFNSELYYTNTAEILDYMVAVSDDTGITLYKNGELSNDLYTLSNNNIYEWHNDEYNTISHYSHNNRNIFKTSSGVSGEYFIYENAIAAPVLLQRKYTYVYRSFNSEMDNTVPVDDKHPDTILDYNISTVESVNDWLTIHGNRETEYHRNRNVSANEAIEAKWYEPIDNIYKEYKNQTNTITHYGVAANNRIIPSEVSGLKVPSGIFMTSSGIMGEYYIYKTELADISCSLSSFDQQTRTATIMVENIGDVDSIGYDSDKLDYHQLLRVDTNDDQPVETIVDIAEFTIIEVSGIEPYNVVNDIKEYNIGTYEYNNTENKMIYSAALPAHAYFTFSCKLPENTTNSDQHYLFKAHVWYGNTVESNYNNNNLSITVNSQQQ